jgi:hypothetical protein
MVRAAASTWVRSALPSGAGGVPTAMKTPLIPDRLLHVRREPDSHIVEVAHDDDVESVLVNRNDPLEKFIDFFSSRAQTTFRPKSKDRRPYEPRYPCR